MPQLHKHFNVSRHPIFPGKAFIFMWTKRRSRRLFAISFPWTKSASILVFAKLFIRQYASVSGSFKKYFHLFFKVRILKDVAFKKSVFAG
ncbi:MAG TPA: hypothetical protein VF540_07750, partial [Segetibacter sp.]